MLGGLRAYCGDRCVTRFSTHKTGALLAYLAYFPQRIHPREVLAELLWPEGDPRAGRNSLNTALSSLRHQLEPPPVPSGAVLQADRVSARLNPASFTTDVKAFESDLRAAGVTSSLTEKAGYLAAAVERYRGELLLGYYDDWIAPEQQRLAGLFADALTQLVRRLERIGDTSQALQYAVRAVQANPLREEAHCDLMRLYAAAGHPSAALDQFRALAQRLAGEFGRSPGEAARQLFREISGGNVDPTDSELAFAAPSKPSTAPPGLPTTSSATATVTFLLTDIEGSTALWERTGDRFRESVAHHHRLLRAQFELHHGQEIQEGGDSFLIAFTIPTDAIRCALACQRALSEAGESGKSEDLPPLRVRMALHTGEVELVAGDYRGLSLHYASRILSAAHGGQTLCSEATASLVRPGSSRSDHPGYRLSDLGAYRLRDLPLPQRLYELQDPDLSIREFPPPVAQAAAAIGAPLQLTRFFGRERELARLEQLLVSEAIRVVTMTGPGGTGKTRLAIATAELLAGALCGAVWFVPLAEVSDADGILDAVLGSMRLPRLPLISPLEQIAGALQPYARQAPPLLILDNFEQLAAEGASVVQALLVRVPTLKCLVTSRQRLDLPGEREYAVAPLPTPEGGESPEALLDYASVKLFVDRAQAARPDFQVTPANAPTLAALCSRLEGLPLALELAAARAQVLSPAQMLAQLERRYDFLVSRRRTTADRHRTLRAAVDWSYQLLSPELRRFFVQLSVFRGGWTLAAAEAVCEMPGTLDALEQLRECSLVLVEEMPEGTGDAVRFRMLESLREFAAEQCDLSEEARLKQRHLESYLALAEELSPRLQSHLETEVRARLESDLDNLRAALTWSREALPERYPRLALGLFPVLYERGSWAEGQRCLQEALNATALAQDGAALLSARCQSELAGLCLDMGDLPGARALAESSLQGYRSLQDARGTAEAHNLLGILAMEGDPEAGREHFGEVLRLRSDPRGRAVALHNLARLSARSGDHTDARRLYEEALVWRRRAGDPRGEAETLQNLGVVAHNDGDLDEAESFYRQCLALYRTARYQYGIAMTLNNLAEVAELDGKLQAAVSLFVHAARMLNELHSRHARVPAEALERLATVVRPAQFREWSEAAERVGWEALLCG